MKKFTKTVEDFVCAQCGTAVSGDGYTNHCPKCLWSRHVDDNPGDRASNCGGMMEPVSAEPDGDGFIVTHKCVVCGHTRRQHTSPNDDIDTIIKLTTNNKYIFGT